MLDSINELLFSRYRDDIVLSFEDNEAIQKIISTLKDLKQRNIKFKFFF
jgi:hypothetical protein